MRIVVILQEVENDAWQAAAPGTSRYFLRQFPAELMQVSPNDAGKGDHRFRKK